MNIILFEPAEVSRNQLLLTGRRAEHINKILRARPGDQLKTGAINGPRRMATVVDIDATQVRLALGAPLPALTPSAETELLMALPRPIMLKRVLAQIASFGVSRLHLVRANRVEKSFFSASLLQPEKIRQRLLLGLEQGGHTRLPEVVIHPRFRPFVEDVLPIISKEYNNKVVAHPGTPHHLANIFQTRPDASTIAAIGPEGGWVDFEINALSKLNFQPFQMGPFILRVDSAVPALLGQITLMQSCHLSVPDAAPPC